MLALPMTYINEVRATHDGRGQLVASSPSATSRD